MNQETTVGFHPGPLLLLGAPGVGKGTQAKVLMAEFGIPQISTGDILRDQRARGTDLGLMADSLIRTGQLVPDELVNRLVEARLLQRDCEYGYILDGFPRTLAQAEWLDVFVTQTTPRAPLVALSIVVKHDELLRRITGRLVSDAGRIYNIYTNPPKTPGICDVDGSVLHQRGDDSIAVFEDRMRIFHQETASVVEHYREQGRFIEIDGSRGMEEVTASVMAALRALRQQ